MYSDLKINFEVDRSSRPFFAKIPYTDKHEFSGIDVRQVPMDILKPAGGESDGYGIETLSVNGTWMMCWGMLSCFSCASTSTMYLCQDNNARTPRAKISFIRTKVVGIEWPPRSPDMFFHGTCIGHFWTEGLMHNTGTKKISGSRCGVTIGIEAGPWAPKLPESFGWIQCD